MKRHLTITPALFVEVILVTMLLGIGSALAVSASGQMPDQGAAGQTKTIGSSNLEVVNYHINYNPELTAVQSVTVTLANRDGSAAHNSVVRVAVGNGEKTVVEQGESTASKAVPAGGTAQETVILKGALDLSDMDWVNVIVEEA